MCDKCAKDDLTCGKCYDEYYLNKQGVCVKCPQANCAKCTANGSRCEKCFPGGFDEKKFGTYLLYLDRATNTCKFW